MSFCRSINGTTPKIRALCFILINSVILGNKQSVNAVLNVHRTVRLIRDGSNQQRYFEPFTCLDFGKQREMLCMSSSKGLT